MTLTAIAKRTEKLLADNSPAILTAVGVTGTLTTAFLTGKASFRASDDIRAVENLRKVDLEPKEKFQLVWRLYIPPVATGVLTVVSIVGANRIGTRRAAAMAAAYSISEKALSEYKDKIIEKIGVNKEQKIRDEVAQDQVNRNPPSQNQIIVTSGGEILCHEAFTGRYFMSSMEALKKAQNETNALVLNNMYASLTDFYNALDIPSTSNSDELGWNTDKLMELEFTTTLSEGDRPCLSFSFRAVPIRDYYRLS